MTNNIKIVDTTEIVSKPLAELWVEAVSLLDNKLEFNFKSAGITKSVTIADLPAESIACILDYGTRKLNDKVNSLFAMPTNVASREQLVELVWQKALEGKLGERRASSSGNVGLRQYILTYLRSKGASAKGLESYKGATPEAIVNGVYAKQAIEQRVAVLAEFNRRYDESLKALDIELDIEF